MPSQPVGQADLTVGAVAAALSFMLFDLFPGPAALVAIVVGGLGAIATKRGRAYGRRLLDVFAGMALALAVVLLLALLLH
jgi:hypothetical protein